MSSRKRPKLESKQSDATNAAVVSTRDESSTSSTERSNTSQHSVQGSLRRDYEGKSAKEESGRTPSRTWYGRTLVHENKARPVTQVAKESINAAVGATSEAVALARSHTPPLSTDAFRKSLGRHGSSASSRLSLPATFANPTSEPSSGNLEFANLKTTAMNEKPNVSGNAFVASDAKDKPAAEESGKAPESLVATNTSTPEKTDQRASWFSWLSRQEAQVPTTTNQGTSQTSETRNSTSIPTPGTEPRSQSRKDQSPKLESKSATPTSDAKNDITVEQRHSWLRLWNTSASPMQPEHDKQPAENQNGSESSDVPVGDKMNNKVKSSVNKTAIDVKSTLPITAKGAKASINSLPAQAESDGSTTKVASGSPQSKPNETTGSVSGHQRSSSWAFWSRDDGKQKSDTNVGELALADSPSRSKPEKDTLDKKGIPVKVERRRSAAINGKDQSVDSAPSPKTDKQGEKRPGSSQESEPAKRAKKPVEAASKATVQPPNLLLPSFESTYGSPSRPGLVQLLTSWVPFASTLHNPKRLEPVQTPTRIKRALVIGVHGYFPAPLVRTLLGQPTGTSIRFANSAASAIQTWVQRQGYSCEIDKVALEGEGKIAERIETLWELLLNWIDKIRKADFVFVACHSQGCPVAIMLVAKLIEFGCVSAASIGVCAMAGVNQGPFLDYRSRWFGATALELFDFARQDSVVSKGYKEALESILKYGVKILYVGSIDDQLVSMESSTFGTMSHPNVYRAVFVDGRVHAPDFLTHLVGFALKLRNLGVSDHGLIRELSSPLAGSLYGGEGHSRIYEDEAVYSLAIEHTLMTAPCKGIPLHVQAEGATSNQNPYILPFAMRGLLEEQYVRTELHSEISELIKQFDAWKPSSKVLKDVKFRLEGVKSKL